MWLYRYLFLPELLTFVYLNIEFAEFILYMPIILDIFVPPVFLCIAADFKIFNVLLIQCVKTVDSNFKRSKWAFQYIQIYIQNILTYTKYDSFSFLRTSLSIDRNLQQPGKWHYLHMLLETSLNGVLLFKYATHHLLFETYRHSHTYLNCTRV